MSASAAVIAAAARALKPSGALWMVANQQLPYERELEALFAEAEVVERSPAYKVLRAAKPRRK